MENKFDSKTSSESKYGVNWSMSASILFSKEDGEEYLGMNLHAVHYNNAAK